MVGEGWRGWWERDGGDDGRGMEGMVGEGWRGWWERDGRE